MTIRQHLEMRVLLRRIQGIVNPQLTSPELQRLPLFCVAGPRIVFALEVSRVALERVPIAHFCSNVRDTHR